MTDKIKFTSQSNPWSGMPHKDLPHMFYMDAFVVAGDEHQGSFTGYVTKDVERLVLAAPALLEALELAESAYRKNCVNEGEPSSILDAMQAAIALAKPQGEQS